MALSADQTRRYETLPHRPLVEYPVLASSTIYAGAAVGESSTTGLVRGLVAADTFKGFAVAQADNSAGASSDISVDVYASGTVELTVVGITAISDEGSSVYASADGTFTLSSTGNSIIGKITRVVSTSATTAMVRFESDSLRSI